MRVCWPAEGLPGQKALQGRAHRGRAGQKDRFQGRTGGRGDGHPDRQSGGGVGGLADPTAIEPEAFYRPIPAEAIGIYPLDFGALEAFRSDRRKRGFFWK